MWKLVPYVGEEAYVQIGNRTKCKEAPISAVGPTPAPSVLVSQHFGWGEKNFKNLLFFIRARFSFLCPAHRSSHGKTWKTQDF